MNDPIKNALDALDTKAGGMATRQAPLGGAGVPYIPPTTSQSSKMQKQIAAEADELVRMNNAARVRMGLEPLPESGSVAAVVPHKAAPKSRAADEGRPVEYRPANANTALGLGCGRGGRMASEAMRAQVQALVSVKRYGWNVALAGLAGCSVSVLKTIKLGKGVREDIAKKLLAVPMHDIEAECNKGRAEKSERAVGNHFGGAVRVHPVASDDRIELARGLVWPESPRPMWMKALKQVTGVGGGLWHRLKHDAKMRPETLERVIAAAQDPATEVLRRQMAGEKPESRTPGTRSEVDLGDGIDQVDGVRPGRAGCVLFVGKDPYAHVHELVKKLREVMQKEMAKPVLRDETTLALMQVLTTLNKEVYGV